MIDPRILFGRLGNQMFQYAFLYSYAIRKGIDFYFQDEKFFKENADSIRELFSIGISKTPIDKVAIHVRRNSNPLNPLEPKYHENPFYVSLCDTDYYERAIAMFPDEKFLVFSDDIEWCKSKWGLDERFEFSTGTEIEDMNSMSRCKAHIIANSSFSWWGAWLSSSYPNNKVIAPKAWYKDGVDRTHLPEHWIRI